MAKILVTGARMWYAYNSICILSDSGHEIYVADSSKLSMGLYSKKIKKKFIYPDISLYSKEFVNKIIQIIDDEKIDYILPVFEETYVLSYYIDLIKDKVKILVPNINTINRLHDKYSLFNISNELKIPCPQTYLLTEYEKGMLSFPLVLKPRRDRGAVGIKIINNQKEFDKFVEKMDKNNYLVQEYLSKEQICTIGLAKDGKLYSNIVYHNLEEYPYKGGFGILRETINNEKIDEYVKKIVETEKYSGFIGVDFLKDSNTEEFKITDINPRMSPGLMIAYSENISLPDIYLDIIDNKEIKKQFSIGGKGSYTSALRIGWFFQVVFSRNFKELKGFVKRKKNKIEDVWKWNDLKPFFVFFIHLLMSVILGPKTYGSQQDYYYKRTLYNYNNFSEIKKKDTQI